MMPKRMVAKPGYGWMGCVNQASVGRIAACCVLVATSLAQADISDTFESSSYALGVISGNSLGAWSISKSGPATVSVVSGGPGESTKYLQLADPDANGGTSAQTFQPMVSRSIGAVTSAISIDFDWYLSASTGSLDKALLFTVRGTKSNNTQAVVAAVTLGYNDLVLLGSTTYSTGIQLGQWAHVTMVLDPLSAGSDAKWKLILTQDNVTYEKTGISMTLTDVVKIDTIAFQLGSGAVTGEPVLGIDNVVVQTIAVPEPASVIGLFGGASLLLAARKR